MSPGPADDIPNWSRVWLRAAGAYNLIWGAGVVLFPHALFDLTGAERMRYPEIWQCVGMIVGVFGIGYLAAASNPRVHWPIVLVGLLGKVLGPLGFAIALRDGVFPPAFGLTILTNDLIWWVPFSMILWDAARSRGRPPEGPAPDLEEALDGAHDQRGRGLREITDERPTLIVLTRHSGCTFCKEALADLRSRRGQIEASGTHLAIVTQSSPSENLATARSYGLDSASWISDPERELYRAFELRRGSFLQLFGPRVVVRGARAFLSGHGVGRLGGDGFQMPGAFVVHRGRVLRAFRHRSAADRPDYQSLACEVGG